MARPRPWASRSKGRSLTNGTSAALVANRAPEGRWLSIAEGGVRLPEQLLLAQAQGEVLFITGAGTSMGSGLPDFRTLVMDLYRLLDPPVHVVLQTIPAGACNLWGVEAPRLSPEQVAEVRRFVAGDYDVVIGMLERRIDGAKRASNRVRSSIHKLLSTVAGRPPVHAKLHEALVRLANRGDVSTIVTTNFDRLLQAAARKRRSRLLTYSLGGIPRPGYKSDFAGVLHIHGVLAERDEVASDVVVTDHDFGEFYLRRRIVPDFIYDAARLYSLVLVGYSANDAPMRYLLNAVAADGVRFNDLKPRYAFVGSATPSDAVAVHDWVGRGITPIMYDSARSHAELESTLTEWADLSPTSGKQDAADKIVRTIVKTPRSGASQHARDLFDHLFRRAPPAERTRLARTASQAHAAVDWLDAIGAVSAEPSRGGT